MRQPVNFENVSDESGRPAGGWASGVGISISWQNGPLREQGTDEPAAPNGAFVEDVLELCAERIDFYQRSEFACDTNARAVAAVREALAALDERTKDRLARDVEGTHQQ